MYRVGDRVRVNDRNNYDEGYAYDPAESFLGREGVIVRIGYEVTVVPEEADTLYHVELEGLHEFYAPENPWPFWGEELDLINDLP